LAVGSWQLAVGSWQKKNPRLIPTLQKLEINRKPQKKENWKLRTVVKIAAKRRRRGAGKGRWGGKKGGTAALGCSGTGWKACAANKFSNASKEFRP
jgi:hypothetical protein